MRLNVILAPLFLLPLLGAWTHSCAGQEPGMPEMKPVLLVMDVQNTWLPMMAEEDRDAAPEKINAAISLFREFGYPVIRVYHSHPERGPQLDTEPFEFLDSIAVTDDDLRIVKAQSSAFTETELGQILNEGGHNTVFLCGLSATGCVLATYFGALERDFMALMVEGTLLSHDASYTKVIEDICYSVTLEELRTALEGK